MKTAGMVAGATMPGFDGLDLDRLSGLVGRLAHGNLFSKKGRKTFFRHCKARSAHWIATGLKALANDEVVVRLAHCLVLRF
jgi:hypothetical protein